jgi:hypothetical protein
VLWVTSETSSEGSNKDLGLAPWAKLSLVQVRVLRCDCSLAHPIMPALPLDTGASINARNRSKSAPNELAYLESCGDCGIMPNAVLAAIPGDVSTFLAAAPRGKVCRLVRHGQDTAANSSTSVSQYLNRVPNQNSILIGGKVGSPSAEEKFELFAAVVCMDVRVPVNCAFAALRPDDESKTGQERVDVPVTFHSPLLLVGRADGSIDLFQMDNHAPLQSWNTSTVGKDNTKTAQRTEPIVYVRWCSQRAGAFVAVDRAGKIFYFDLLLDPFNPVATDSLPTGRYSPSTVNLSSRRQGSRAAYMLAAPRVDDGKADGLSGLQLRRMNECLTNSTLGSREESPAAVLIMEELSLRAGMSSWIGMTSTNDVQIVMNGSERPLRK